MGRRRHVSECSCRRGCPVISTLQLPRGTRRSGRLALYPRRAGGLPRSIRCYLSRKIRSRMLSTYLTTSIIRGRKQGVALGARHNSQPFAEIIPSPFKLVLGEHTGLAFLVWNGTMSCVFWVWILHWVQRMAMGCRLIAVFAEREVSRISGRSLSSVYMREPCFRRIAGLNTMDIAISYY